MLFARSVLLALKKLYVRPVEVTVCVAAFALGMTSLVVSWTLTAYSAAQLRQLETSLAARSYVITPAQFDFFGLFDTGFVKAGTLSSTPPPFQVSDLRRFQTSLNGLATAFFAEERFTAPNGDDNQPPAIIHEVTADYLDAVPLTLIAGRTLTKRDFALSSPIILITDTYAKEHLGSPDPTGRKLTFAFASDGTVKRVVLTVVGVFKNPGCQADFVVDFCTTGASDVGFVPFGVFQATAKNLVVVTPNEFSPGVLELLSTKVNRDDSGLSIINMDHTLKQRRAQANSQAVISTLFALGGLVVAAITMGALVYGWVDARRQLIATAKAIGASRARIVLDYLMPVGAIAMAGALLGVFVTLFLLNTLGSWGGEALALQASPIQFLTGALVTTLIGLASATLPVYLVAINRPGEQLRV